ncbi:hypothetical protein Bbelb_388020 [Branchiostoma belcheri]|nr:hypothetical protein Bbelb_388020 [Branchiostoma belcheri]
MPVILKASVTTRRTCFCVLSTCKNVGNRTASLRGEYHLRTESYGFGSTQTRRRTLSACNTFSTCGLRIYHPCVRVRATRVPRTAYERATYGLRESNFTILTCNCCTDSARSTCVPRTVLASSVLTPHFPVDLLNDHAEHTCSIPVYKDNLTGDCQLVSKMPRKAQKKTTRQDPKKNGPRKTPGRLVMMKLTGGARTYNVRVSTACTRQRSNRTEIVRCKHVQLTYHLRNVRCTQPLTARRVVQTTRNSVQRNEIKNPAKAPSRRIPTAKTKKLYQMMLQCWQRLPEDRPTFSDLVEQLKGMMVDKSLLNTVRRLPQVSNAWTRDGKIFAKVTRDGGTPETRRFNSKHDVRLFENTHGATLPSRIQTYSCPRTKFQCDETEIAMVEGSHYHQARMRKNVPYSWNTCNTKKLLYVLEINHG